MKPSCVILEGITGSVAYGLNTETSDEDIRGIFVANTRDILGILGYRETYDHTDPDWCFYEVGKYIKLALGGNPTVLELLFLEHYTQISDVGRMLIKNRNLFLSNVVRKTYYGYAYSQMKKLNDEGRFGNGRTNRYQKHARHCYRLLYQGRELLETGKITVKVTPKARKELFALGNLDPSELVDKFTEESHNFDNITSVLPDKPDLEAVNELLLKIRMQFL